MSSATRESPGPLRVFIIDDHALYRAGLREAFEAEDGVEVVGESETGVDALERVTESDAQIVLVDLRLPGVDGIEVCKSLEGSRARCVVLTSFHASEADLVRAAAAGASAYLVKGVGIKELVVSIKAVASGSDLLASSGGVHRYP